MLLCIKPITSLVHKGRFGWDCYCDLVLMAYVGWADVHSYFPRECSRNTDHQSQLRQQDGAELSYRGWYARHHLRMCCLPIPEAKRKYPGSPGGCGVLVWKEVPQSHWAVRQAMFEKEENWKVWGLPKIFSVVQDLCSNTFIINLNSYDFDLGCMWEMMCHRKKQESITFYVLHTVVKL